MGGSYVPHEMELGDHSTLGELERYNERMAKRRAEMLASGEIPNPRNCPFMTGWTSDHHLVCTYTGGKVWVDCTRSVCGEEPRCSYAPVDNSPEACAKRLERLCGTSASSLE